MLPGIVLVLAGCASTGPAPVRDLGLGPAAPRTVEEPRPTPAAAPGRYRVQRGDTLYSIAFRNGLDYRELADWNGIAAPYTIRAGEELRLTAPAGWTARPAKPAPDATADATRAALSPGMPTPFQPVAPAAASPTPASTAAATADTPADTAAPTAPRATETAAPAPVASSAPVAERTAAGEPVWRWPANGKLVGRFAPGDPVRQGIDIAGDAGDPVRAAASGTVVYSGNGLIGYGELIIIKHDSTWLSAYGHNRKRLVAEGQRVAAGDVIAEMGASSANRNALHFEVRRKGKPVDPLDHLPRR